MLMLEITFLKDCKLWLQESLFPGNIPLGEAALHRIISLVLNHSEEIEKLVIPGSHRNVSKRRH